MKIRLHKTSDRWYVAGIYQSVESLKPQIVFVKKRRKNIRKIAKRYC